MRRPAPLGHGPGPGAGRVLGDAGLEHLRALTELQTLQLRFTKVTDTGVADLKKALPNCKIYK